MPGITVGIDGSHNSQQALEWAIREAALRGAALTVLTVNEVAANQWTGNPLLMESDPAAAEQARQAAQDAVAKVSAQIGGPKPASVDVHAVSGFAARELIDASKDSDLLVIGSRGGGGFTRLMLGSVSSQVVHHAACPVVVVPTGR